MAVIANHNGDSFTNEYSTARNNFYPSSGSPTVYFDGIITMVGAGGDMYPSYAAKVNQRMAIETPFDIDITYTSNGNRNYTATVDISKVGAYDDDLVLYMFVTESHIPQSWGEMDEINYVNRLMVPDQWGTDLDFSNGNNIVEELSFDLPDGLDRDNCEIVVAIQNNSTKEIFNGAKISMLYIFENDAAIKDMAIPQALCSDEIGPIIYLKNEGSDEMTSATILYSINDEEVHSFEWTGALAFEESESVQLPAVSYTISDTYTIGITVENPNNTPDEDTDNNSMSSSTNQAGYFPQNCKLAILPNSKPEETTWDIKSNDGSIIASGGPYTSASLNIIDFTWPENDCYTFTLYDAGGDGMIGGFYKITNSSTQVIWEGNVDFTYQTSVELAYDELMAIDQTALNNEVSVYPNPIIDHAQVDFTLVEQSQVSIDIYNLLGKKIITVYNGRMIAGAQSIQINIDNLDNGIYFVNIEIDGQLTSKKISIQK